MRCLFAVTLLGCYSPRSYNCAIACEYTGEKLCPPGTECGDDNMCHDDDSVQCNLQGPEAGAPTTCAGKDDAPFFRVCADGVAIREELVLDQPINEPGDCHLVRNGNCVMVAQTIRVTASVRATGAGSLVLLGLRGIEVTSTGEIDVAARAVEDVRFTTPAGSRTTCTAGNGTPAPMITNATAGAGAGAAFAHPGGKGGSGSAAGGAVEGGVTNNKDTGLVFQGGCRGGTGGGSSISNVGGFGGGGGGAVYLVSNGNIDITGTINASGGGGAAAGIARSGGGGGGSGGMILVYTPTRLALLPGARVFALGGGGSPGAMTGSTVTGNDPKGPQLPAAMAATAGAGIGAPGGSYDTPDGQPGGVGPPNSGGGGGGGGGVGFIKFAGGALPPADMMKVAPAAQ